MLGAKILQTPVQGFSGLLKFCIPPVYSACVHGPVKNYNIAHKKFVWPPAVSIAEKAKVGLRMAKKVSGTSYQAMAGSGTTNISITPNVTFSSAQAPVIHRNFPRQVTITAIPSNLASAIKKILIKAVNKGSKEPKTFTLRNIDTVQTSTCSALVTLIRAQLQDDITEDSFEVGYLKGSTTVTLRSKEDLMELWDSIKKENNVTLWCDGLKCSGAAPPGGKKRPTDDSGDNGEGKKSKKRKTLLEGKEEEVESILCSLKDKLKGQYTPMQYRIWAEMLAGGVHRSYNDPPKSTMFVHAGGGVGTKKKATAANVISDAITQLSSALSPKPVSSTTSSGGSPGKVIENRSRCYKQLAELKKLVELGVLSEAECAAERQAIMCILKKYH